MKAEDFMGETPEEVDEDLERVKPFIQPVGTYGETVTAVGREEYLNSLPKTDDGKVLVPDNLLKEGIVSAALTIMSLATKYPHLEEDLVAVSKDLHNVVLILNGEYEGEDEDLGGLIQSGFGKLNELCGKYPL